jgi:hypothetical protein
MDEGRLHSVEKAKDEKDPMLAALSSRIRKKRYRFLQHRAKAHRYWLLRIATAEFRYSFLTHCETSPPDVTWVTEEFCGESETLLGST